MEKGGTILITGGSGFFGHEFVRRCEGMFDRIIVYSRDEHKQEQMAREFAGREDLRFFVGDVRDVNRLHLALRRVDYVIHAAALKVVPSCEYNPLEAVRTNVDGTANVIVACLASSVKRAVFLSTDKAVNPINLYGATKMTAERLWLGANFYEAKFTIVRYGNVMGSTGSVLELYRKLIAGGTKELPLTHPDMTRFWVQPEQAVEAALSALEQPPATILVPWVLAFRVDRLIKALGATAKIVGLRPGEKIAETLIGGTEMPRTFAAPDPRYFIIYPELCYIEPEVPWVGTLVSRSSVASDSERQLSEEDIQELISDQVREPVHN